MEIQEITVDMSLLNTDIGELDDALGQLRNHLNGVFTDIQELDMMWDGPANTEFQKQFTNDHQNMENMCETIKSIIENYRNANKEYTSCENSVYDAVASINI